MLHPASESCGHGSCAAEKGQKLILAHLALMVAGCDELPYTSPRLGGTKNAERTPRKVLGSDMSYELAQFTPIAVLLFLAAAFGGVNLVLPSLIGKRRVVTRVKDTPYE